MSSPSLHSVKSTRQKLGDIGNTKFWELAKAGAFDVRKMGNRAYVTDESLQKFIESLPPATFGNSASSSKVASPS